MKVSIIIPNWNGAEKLIANLPSVFQSIEGYEAEVIVVDDASTDNSVQILKTDFPSVRLIERKFNGGFSTTVNQGVKEAKGQIVVQLNSDAKPQKDFLKFGLPHFEDPKVFSVGCNVGGLWSVAEWRDGYFWHHQASAKESGSEAHRTLWASGGSALFRRDLWLEFGGLDELFNPFYEEDVDLGYRAAKRGFLNLWEPKSKVEHYKQKGVIASNFSTGAISAVAQRNQLLFMWKNITDPLMMSEHRLALAGMLLKHPKYWLVFLSALAKLPKLMAKRRIEQRQAQLSDHQVLDLIYLS